MNRILILEDNKKLAKFYKDLLTKEKYETRIVYNSSDFFLEYDQFPAELLILDIKLNNSEMNGLQVFESLIKKELLQSKVIVLSGEATRTEIATAMKLGAYTFVEKTGEFNIQKFLADVRQAINLKIQENKTKQLTNENLRLRKELFTLHPFIGKSEKIQKTKKLLSKFAKADADILLLGETGSGKEVAANFFYQSSPRFGQPFIKVNSGGIPETMIDAELFGHKRGSFTGAVASRKGYFEQAENGILFLDEISNMNLTAQAKILRAIEYKEIRILGGELKKVNVNLLFASNKIPNELIENGQLREDLFYRLEGNTIYIPPLRDRDDDILLLTNNFFQKYCSKHNCHNHTDIGKLKKMLKSYHWPGNVRELKKFCEYVVILHDIIDNEVIEAEFKNKLNGKMNHDNLKNLLNIPNYEDAINIFKKKYLRYKISVANGNVNSAAQAIGLDKATIYKLKKKLKF